MDPVGGDAGLWRRGDQPPPGAPSTSARPWSHLLRRQISGLIVAAVSPDQSAANVPRQQRTPVVFVDRAPRGAPPSIYVIEDDLAGAREARLHLASSRPPAGGLLR